MNGGLMIGDHINKYMLGHSVTWLYATVCVRAFVQSGPPGTLERGLYRRTMLRLAIFGALATPGFHRTGGTR